jgi:hypothetical protein
MGSKVNRFDPPYFCFVRGSFKRFVDPTDMNKIEASLADGWVPYDRHWNYKALQAVVKDLLK